MSKDWKPEEPAEKAMTSALECLSKYFPNVQIFCSRIDPSPESEDEIGTTQRMIQGRGNFYARLGQVKDWIVMENERSRAEARRRVEEE